MAQTPSRTALDEALRTAEDAFAYYGADPVTASRVTLPRKAP